MPDLQPIADCACDDQKEVIDAQKRVQSAEQSFFVIVLLAAGPFIMALTAGTVAAMLGHPFNEAHAPDIPVIGKLLYAMGVLGWLGLVTIPLGVLCLPFSYINIVVYRGQLAQAQKRYKAKPQSANRKSANIKYSGH